MHSHKNHGTNSRRSIRDFLPLIVILFLIGTFVTARQIVLGADLLAGMKDFMGSFFIVFGSFKLIKWKGFADAYSTYDVLAKRSKVYAYAYPLIELMLGISYFVFENLTAVNVVTLIVMAVSSIGVAQELAKKNDIPCACLGVVFKIPMTKVTLFEDLTMAGMALIMLAL